jgi:hypothetical protein
MTRSWMARVAAAIFSDSSRDDSLAQPRDFADFYPDRLCHLIDDATCLLFLFARKRVQGTGFANFAAERAVLKE